MKYRAEIDGLRAVAVVSVILFHAGFELFSGGFVGVDVFFVISGYLITNILINDIENNQFNVLTFYERRARRILPALFFVMIVCIPFAWFWMVPTQMKGFSKSLAAVSLFGSNVLFWLEGGYFAMAAEEKPLLHTWSLAVEEQFYFLFPIFLLVTWRFGKDRVIWLIVFLSICSLALSEWGWRNADTANFYLAPARLWEIFAGSLSALILSQRRFRANNKLSILGLTAIVLAVFLFDESTPFPSVFTLVPVLGVVLIILFADKETFVSKLLSTRGFVGIGLISYSTYLWHQPLFAFARIRDLDSPLIFSILAPTSAALGYLSWKYIENPFRNKNGIISSQKQVFSIALAFTTIFTGIGFVGYAKEGFQEYYLYERMSNKQRYLYEKYSDEVKYDMYEHMRTEKECHLWERSFEKLSIENISNCKMKNDLSILIVGGSHAMNLFNIFAVAFPNLTIIGVSQGYCRLSDWKSYCTPSELFDGVRHIDGGVDFVVYHQAGKSLELKENNWNKLEENLPKLEKATDSSFLIFGPWVEGRTNFEELIQAENLNGITAKEVRELMQIDHRFAVLSQKLQHTYVSLFKLFSPTLTNLVENECLLYRDDNHISRCGEELLGERYRDQLVRIFERN